MAKTKRRFPDHPREEVSCPACGKVYGSGGTSVCTGCEECSKCCRCKSEGRVWVDADTFVDGIAEREAAGKQLPPAPPIVAGETRRTVSVDPLPKVYPEHAKLREVADKTQFVHDFLTFCGEQGFHLVHKDDRDHTPSQDDLLYKFIDVDYWKLENEKRDMLGQDPVPGPKKR